MIWAYNSQQMGIQIDTLLNPLHGTNSADALKDTLGITFSHKNTHTHALILGHTINSHSHTRTLNMNCV